MQTCFYFFSGLAQFHLQRIIMSQSFGTAFVGGRHSMIVLYSITVDQTHAHTSNLCFRLLILHSQFTMCTLNLVIKTCKNVKRRSICSSVNWSSVTEDKGQSTTLVWKLWLIHTAAILRYCNTRLAWGLLCFLKVSESNLKVTLPMRDRV